MPKEGFLKRHRIVRHTIREDLLFFAIPGILVLFAGMVVSSRDGFAELIYDFLINHQEYARFSAPNLIGFALIILGFAIAFSALFTLRHNYASTLVIRENHQLITHGIYRYVCHPIYLGVLLVVFGVPVSVSSTSGFLILALLFPIFLIRIRLEEKLLLAEFGETYQEYKDTTCKLIPFLF